MADSILIVRRQQQALDRAAQILGVRPPAPSAKTDPDVREAYMAELILALAERVGGNEPEANKSGVDSAPPFRIPG
jgi:hypothetical protein